MPTLILGSASPRRAELLHQLGLHFTVSSADIDERQLPQECPEAYVRRMAQEKSDALNGSTGDAVLLTADTTVIIDGVSLGKPQDSAHARTMLESLSGRSHVVATAVLLRRGDQTAEVLVATDVEFADLSPPLIDCYLESSEPWDKAGAYAIQGLAASFVRRIDGSVSNVIGLPLVETRELLAQFGVEALLAGGDA